MKDEADQRARDPARSVEYFHPCRLANIDRRATPALSRQSSGSSGREAQLPVSDDEAHTGLPANSLPANLGRSAPGDAAERRRRQSVHEVCSRVIDFCFCAQSLYRLQNRVVKSQLLRFRFTRLSPTLQTCVYLDTIISLLI